MYVNNPPHNIYAYIIYSMTYAPMCSVTLRIEVTAHVYLSLFFINQSPVEIQCLFSLFFKLKFPVFTEFLLLGSKLVH